MLTGSKQKNNSRNRIRDGQARTAWLFSAPALLLIAAFIIIPFVMSIGYSFTNKMLVQRSGKTVDFVGLQNYLKIFTDSTTRTSFINTFKYALIVVPCVLLLSTLLAVLVNKPVKGVKAFRAIYFSPQVVTMTAVAVVWGFLLSSGSSGMLNSFLGLFGVPAQKWLQDKSLALICIAVMYIWQTLGLNMVIVLGGLQYIPIELYEAAYMDGCNMWQKFWYITVPSLKNTLVYVLISTTINSLKIFTQVYILTSGGPQGSTTTVVYQLYKAGFENQQLGYSSAISVVFFLIVFVISQIQNKALEGNS